MMPTVFGLLVLVAGLALLLRGDAMSLLALMMVCSLFGGSAAVILVALGGSSIPPNQFALLFATLRVALPGGGQIPRLGEAFRETRFLLIYALYGIFGAFVLSRVFAGAMEVVPLRTSSTSAYLFETAPLAFSPQNITVSVYLTGTLLAAAVAYVAMHAADAPRRFVRVAVVIGWVHIFFGVSAILLKGSPYDGVIDFIRNANYTQTDQVVIGGYARLTGVMPEPSVYAGFAFVWFVFLFECWLRGLNPRRTGPVALALALVLLLSTSSTAYAALAIYAVLLVPRFLLFPHGLGVGRMAVLAAVLLGCMALVAILALVQPQLVADAWRIVLTMTVEKQASSSGLQRAFWAKVGLDAFSVSWGLGIGAGSFRSSTLLTAVLGSVGVVGAAAILLHVVRVLRPLSASTFSGEDGIARYGLATMVGTAAAWAVLGALIPAILLAPSCDPGMDFAVFSGVALALRREAAEPGRETPARPPTGSPAATSPTARWKA